MTETIAGPDLRTLGALYEDTRQRLIDLVRQSTRDDLFAAATPVPACADWRVRDVIAHLSGLATDIASGNIDGAATDEWTAAQVDARRDLSIGDLLAESDEVGPQLASFLDDFPGRYGLQVVADINVHEHDIRGALKQPGARESAGIAHCVEFLLTTFVAPAARVLGLPALLITDGMRSAVIGGCDDEPTDPTAATQAALASPPVPRLEASSFELVRAFTGRRSLDQVHRLGWSVDPTPYDGLFGLWPFALRNTDLVE